MYEYDVRIVQEHRGEYPSLWAVIESIAPKVGCVTPTLFYTFDVEKKKAIPNE